MRRLVEARVVRAVVLLLAFGVGGVAGAPTMAMPPRGVSISGADDEPDGDGGGGGGDGPDDPPPPPNDPLLIELPAPLELAGTLR